MRQRDGARHAEHRRSPKSSGANASAEEMERAMELVADFTGWSVSNLRRISANGEAAAECESAAAS